jgi:transcriptional regulator with PAS, ATPase and Fis domain
MIFNLEQDLTLFISRITHLHDQAITLLLDQQCGVLFNSNEEMVYRDSDLTKIINQIKRQLKKDSFVERNVQASSNKLYVHTWKKVIVHENNFNGSLHILEPSDPESVTLSTQIPNSKSNISLSQTFHSTALNMQQMFTIIQRVALTEFPVLVRGESGSGKELVAKAIHDYSQRKKQVFIAINCAALNVNILESELFGHVKGAFTGAIRDHKGVFERAAGGTLFLDEIAEIPLELQAKLLRVLETGEFTRLGGEMMIKANVRIITATHRALREEAKMGRFRQDLLYRLRVIPIFVPPLRDRKVDISPIIDWILKENALNYRNHLPKLTTNAMQALISYDWPGNVRELKNTMLYALTMADGEPLIDIEHLPHEVVNNVILDELDMSNNRALTSQQIHGAMRLHGNHLDKVADALGISRTTLWRYRKKYDL